MPLEPPVTIANFPLSRCTRGSILAAMRHVGIGVALAAVAVLAVAAVLAASLNGPLLVRSADAAPSASKPAPTASKPAPTASKPAPKQTTEQQLRAYAGRIVFSPDAPPTQLDEFPRYLKANATADNRYDVLKGPPWQFHLVAVLAKDPGDKPLSLVFADKDDKKLTTLHAVDVRAQKKLVTASSEATVAAGFAANKTYVVRLMQGKTVLAKAELHLRY